MFLSPGNSPVILIAPKVRETSRQNVHLSINTFLLNHYSYESASTCNEKYSVRQPRFFLDIFVLVQIAYKAINRRRHYYTELCRQQWFIVSSGHFTDMKAITMKQANNLHLDGYQVKISILYFFSHCLRGVELASSASSTTGCPGTFFDL